ncbi:glycosyltransferase [Candidatus Woesearchaeota archaeon]|nr:glycosyltransferase [Candidatus Woesearchaeota archaeon]
MRPSYIAYIGTYPPRQCGIATFTQDLSTAISNRSIYKTKPKIIALTNGFSTDLEYPKEVMYNINETLIEDYINVAKKINQTRSIKLVCVQHEFGIYGGKFLNYLSAFLETIEKPVVLTLHSVVPKPPANLRYTIKYLAEKTSALIVMADKAVDILTNDYKIPRERITVIPHGIHKVPFERSSKQKKKLKLRNKLVITSFGLISGGKDYETIIKALPPVVKKFPNLLYLIIGATHPGILKQEGEKYRYYLTGLIDGLNLQKNIRFVNKYLKLNKLLQYLRATDVFVSSGKGLGQITSGTLSYAMGCGRPVVTMPFMHAKEIVTSDRGILVPMGNSKAYTKALIRLLSNPGLRLRMGQNCYDFTRHMLWSNVAKSYLDLFDQNLN